MLRVAPARFVTIELAEVVIGLTAKAIRRKIEDGILAEGKQYRRRDGADRGARRPNWRRCWLGARHMRFGILP